LRRSERRSAALSGRNSRLLEAKFDLRSAEGAV
jgi:hypothetical protein